jgi:hypothetical protein
VTVAQARSLFPLRFDAMYLLQFWTISISISSNLVNGPSATGSRHQCTDQERSKLLGLFAGINKEVLIQKSSQHALIYRHTQVGVLRSRERETSRPRAICAPQLLSLAALAEGSTARQQRVPPLTHCDRARQARPVSSAPYSRSPQPSCQSLGGHRHTAASGDAASA